MGWSDLSRIRVLRWAFGASALVATCSAATAQTEENRLPNFNLYGVPGVIDLPSAETAPNSTLATSASYFGNNTRIALNFQITPRLSGSFRYARIRDFRVEQLNGTDYFDRSFDVRYQLLFEGDVRPSVVVGLQDFIGTGLYSGEYIVATKEIYPGLRLTGGLGWGRLGTEGAIGSIGTRPQDILGEGGVPTYDRWFRGDVAPFGGITYSPNDRLTFSVEYSSDGYVEERSLGQFDGSSQINYGVGYNFKSGTQLALYHMYGEEIGFRITVATNPRLVGSRGGSENAPEPVRRRAPGTINDLGWTNIASAEEQTKGFLAPLLEEEGIRLEGFKLDARRASLRISNLRYFTGSQAIGRTARVLTRTLPASVEEFVIVPVQKGIPMSAVVLRRSDLENLENEAAVDMLARTSIIDAYGMEPGYDRDLYPRFGWALTPYFRFSAFDPESPLRAEVGARVSANIEIVPSFVLSGSVTKRVAGNLDEINQEASSELPAVRTDFPIYAAEGDPALETLTAAWYSRPGRDVYGRFTAGYLEPMYAGASAEMLWKPVDSRLALGAEVNYVRRRDFDQGLGIQSNMTDSGEIPTVNGHVSAYYNFGSGFHGQVDVGRYLAGDYGATFTIDREFSNGWRVGAFATFTDVPFEVFGEGSFDKGIRISIPLEWSAGTPSRKTNNITIRSLTRDGGARLRVGGRLYNQVRDYHETDIVESWGKFWR